MGIVYGANSNGKVITFNQIKRMIIIFLISITVIQQMPIIRDIYYSEIRASLYIFFGLFSLVSFVPIKKYAKHNLIRYLLIVMLYALLLTALVISLGKTTYPVMQFLLPFGILICSLNTSFSYNQLGKFLLLYAGLVAVMGISSIYYYGEGFEITQTYTIPLKNQIGPMLGIAAIIGLVGLIDKSQLALKRNYWITKIIIVAISCSALVVIRNRSGILALLLVIIMMLFAEYRPRMTRKMVVVGQISLIVVFVLLILGKFDPIYEAVWKSFTLNYDVNDYQSLSAGRVDTYKEALAFSFNHPFVGEIATAISYNSVAHNYILNNWLRYGIVGSLPIVMLYLYYYAFAIRGIANKQSQNAFTLPLWVLLFSLIVSNFEYTYPYGPGVSQLMLWFLIGQYLKGVAK